MHAPPCRPQPNDDHDTRAPQSPGAKANPAARKLRPKTHQKEAKKKKRPPPHELLDRGVMGCIVCLLALSWLANQSSATEYECSADIEGSEEDRIESTDAVAWPLREQSRGPRIARPAIPMRVCLLLPASTPN